MSDVTIPRLHGIRAVQERLSLSRSSVFQLIGSGELRSVKVAGRRLVPEQAIIDFIAKLDSAAQKHYLTPWGAALAEKRFLKRFSELAGDPKPAKHKAERNA